MTKKQTKNQKQQQKKPPRNEVATPFQQLP